MAVADPSSFASPDSCRTHHLYLRCRVDFESRSLRGTAALTVRAERDNLRCLILDTKDLTIHKTLVNGQEATFALGERHSFKGTPMEITLPFELGKVATTRGLEEEDLALVLSLSPAHPSLRPCTCRESLWCSAPELPLLRGRPGGGGSIWSQLGAACYLGPSSGRAALRKARSAISFGSPPPSPPLAAHALPAQ
ncbi:UNVERIFIED_CONTAM: hypothetical protein K2H54_074397 [Gekko kuhli]